jgi:carboxypeptidase C (cathepsin A)
MAMGPRSRGSERAVRAMIGMAVALLLALAPAATAPVLPAIAPMAEGDEPIVVTRHTIHTDQGQLRYEAHAGRLAIRNDETGEVRGHVFFTAYVVPPRDGRRRPITFLWNGGPTVNSLPLHTEMFGPRQLSGPGFVDNLQTLLTVSDLVFYDPVGTGFSRPEGGGAADEFYSTLGDFAATAEFIRAYRTRFGAARQPLFLAGESYGTWRVSGVSELLVKAGTHVDGAILISGGIPGSQMADSFSDAMYVPARTAAAFYHRKLPPELMRDRAATLRQAADWARSVYMPALERRASLSAEEHEAIAHDLARFIGISPDKVDRTMLVVTNRAYLQALLGDGRTLDTFDMRRIGPERDDPARNAALASYLREELGYATDLAYTGLENGYMPRPGPDRRSTGSRWSYNHVEITPAMMTRAQAGGGPPGSQPWLQRAMRADPGLRVFVAAGRFDSLNMCEGNIAMAGRLEPPLAARFTIRCYEGGHMMYRDESERLRLAEDVGAFVASAARP